MENNNLTYVGSEKESDICLGEVMLEKKSGVVYLTLPILDKISPTENFLEDMKKATNLIQKAYIELIMENDLLKSNETKE